MKMPLSTGGDLGEFILSELLRRNITMRKVSTLPELLGSWRSHATPDVKDRPTCLVLSVRGCTLEEVASFCFALFAQGRSDSPHVLLTRHATTGTTVFVNAQRKETDQEFDFQISDGFGHFSRTHAGIVVFFHRRKTASFVVAETEKGLEILFTEHKTV